MTTPEMVDAIGERVRALVAENARLREALGRISKQKLSAEMSEELAGFADFEGGYDAIVTIAREALNPK